MTPTLTRPGPVRRPAATDWGAAPADLAGGSARILYAEDDPLLRRLGKLVLDRSGYSVETVEDGAAAWLALNEGRYHLLITDHDMPHLTGLELITKVRRAGMHLPIVVTSGSFNPRDELSGAVAGLTAFLAKPFTSEMLSATVAQTLRTANHRHPGHDTSTSVAAQQTGSQPSHPHGGFNG